jgi:hypothetical protein
MSVDPEDPEDPGGANEEDGGISQTLATAVEQGRSFQSPSVYIAPQSSLFALFGSPDLQFEYEDVDELSVSLHKHRSVVVHVPVFVPPELNLSE